MAPSTAWKNPMPVMNAVPNVVVPQRVPIKEFPVVNKPEYSPEYRPEAVVLPPTHRGGFDDDRGPIHTIPAPNLSIADKPINPDENNRPESHQDDYQRFQSESDYNSHSQGINYLLSIYALCPKFLTQIC